jgi:hypothetical protein
VLCKVARLARRPMLREIGRCSTEDAPGWRQLAHNERRILERANPDRKVEPLVDEIYVRQARRHVDGRVGTVFQEGSERRRHMHPAEGVGRRNAKRAARLALKRAQWSFADQSHLSRWVRRFKGDSLTQLVA